MATAPDVEDVDNKHWTVADYMELEADGRYEILEGDLVMVPSPNIHHQHAITEFGRLVGTHVRDHDLGECFHTPFDVVLADDEVVQPDFTFVRDDRIAELYDGHCITGAPDMVVEVLSKSTASRDRHRKRQMYARAGVPWLLFVEPEARVVEAFQLSDDDKYVLEATAAEDDQFEFGLFPDLSVDLSEIWFDPPDQADSES